MLTGGINMNFPSEIIIVPVVFLSVIYVIKLSLEHKLRRLLISKEAVNENIKHLFIANEQAGRLSSLKWGMLLVAVGVGLIAGQLLPYDAYSDQVAVSFLFLSGGIALLVYYFIAGKIERDGNGK
jgi:hypothetical protein